jgi:hypothetical protein
MTDISKNAELQQSCITAVKSRFLAQYWGTKTLYIGGVGVVEVGKGGWNLKHPDFFLQLKSISNLSDEDAIELNDLMKWYEEIEVDRIIILDVLDDLTTYNKSYPFNESLLVYDFLRSKGYALPFMKYSIEDLVSFGWVQLL